jgi:plasmid maintenance system antidote protein VapI
MVDFWPAPPELFLLPDTAARLARYFGGDAASWLVPQADFDLKALATRGDIARKVSLREGVAMRSSIGINSLERSLMIGRE